MIRTLARHAIAMTPLVLVLLAIASTPGPAHAQQPADPPAAEGADATPVEEDAERIGELIATLEDDESRQRLVDQLRLLADAAAPAEEARAARRPGDRPDRPCRLVRPGGSRRHRLARRVAVGGRWHGNAGDPRPDP